MKLWEKIPKKSDIFWPKWGIFVISGGSREMNGFQGDLSLSPRETQVGGWQVWVFCVLLAGSAASSESLHSTCAE